MRDALYELTPLPLPFSYSANMPDAHFHLSFSLNSSFPPLFPDQFEIPGLFQVFQINGNPDCNCTEIQSSINQLTNMQQVLCTLLTSEMWEKYESKYYYFTTNFEFTESYASIQTVTAMFSAQPQMTVKSTNE